MVKLKKRNKVHVAMRLDPYFYQKLKEILARDDSTFSAWLRKKIRDRVEMEHSMQSRKRKEQSVTETK